MAKKMKKRRRINGSKEVHYLSKRDVLRAARPAIIKASKRAMQTEGFVIIAEGDYIVRVNKDGTREILNKIGGKAHHTKIALR